MTDVIEKLKDLHKQATVDRSHYYTGSVISEAIVELARLRELEALVLEWQEARATYIELCGDDNKVDLDIALRLSLATVSLEAWGRNDRRTQALPVLRGNCRIDRTRSRARSEVGICALW